MSEWVIVKTPTEGDERSFPLHLYIYIYSTPHGVANVGMIDLRHDHHQSLHHPVSSFLSRGALDVLVRSLVPSI